MKKVKSFSHTKVRVYEACPLQFKGIYIDGLDVESVNPNIVFGSVGHVVFSRYLKHLKEKGLKTDITAIRRIARETFSDKEVRKENPLPAARLDELIEISERFTEVTMIDESFYGSEISFAFKRDLTPCEFNDPDVFFRGRLDRLDIEGAVATITDYKTLWHADYDPLQAENYAWAIFLLFPEVVTVIPQFFFPRPDIMKRAKEAFDREDLEGLQKRVLLRIELIECDTDFLPTPGSACSYCVLDCPAALSNLRSVKSLEDAEKAANDLLLLAKKKKDAEEALKSWLNENNDGKVTVNDQVFGFHTTESISFPDVRDFNATCQEFNRDPNAFLNVNNTKAKKLLKDKDEKVRAAFAKIAEESRKQTWGKRKAKKGE